jgi:SAM-dependent methyltransferase
MPADSYSSIAPYYDLLHAGLTEDVGFALTLAARNQGPVLELGCGTGRLLLPLARAGHEIVGLDISAAMLRRAQQRLATETAAVRGRARLVAGNMTRIPLASGRFALAVVPYNTFLHLEWAEAVTAVEAIARQLRPGGCLFLDLANPFAVEQTPGDRLLSLEQVLADPESGNTVVVLAASQLKQGTQLLNITWVFDVSPAAGGAVERTVAQVAYHYYFPHQIEIILQEGGLQLEAFYGDYGEAEFDESAGRLLVIARKPA